MAEILRRQTDGFHCIICRLLLKAIVTTWKGVSKEWATSWIEYHAALGFTRLFIFWDDPDFDRQTIDFLSNDPVYSWVVDSYEPDEDYKSKFLSAMLFPPFKPKRLLMYLFRTVLDAK